MIAVLMSLVVIGAAFSATGDYVNESMFNTDADFDYR